MIIGLGLFLVGCTSEGLPADFADQNNRIERQFVSSCVAAQEGENVDEATEYCECSFYTAASELGFEGFLELDKALQENPQGLTTEQVALFENISLPCPLGPEDI